MVSEMFDNNSPYVCTVPFWFDVPGKESSQDRMQSTINFAVASSTKSFPTKKSKPPRKPRQSDESISSHKSKIRARRLQSIIVPDDELRTEEQEAGRVRSFIDLTKQHNKDFLISSVKAKERLKQFPDAELSYDQKKSRLYCNACRMVGSSNYLWMFIIIHSIELSIIIHNMYIYNLNAYMNYLILCSAHKSKKINSEEALF